MDKLTQLQKVIDDFWKSYSNPLAFDKPIIKIVDLFDDVAKGYVSKDLHDIKCFAVVRSETHYSEEDDEEQQDLVETQEVCFRMKVVEYGQEELLLKKLKEYFHEKIK
jgi:hypothetical protein